MPGLMVVDEDGNAVELDAGEARTLLAAFEGLEPATVSACPDCACRVLAAVALVDLLDAGAPHPRAGELVELADEAPSLHLYVVDAAECAHRRWRDPLHDEWLEALEEDRLPPVRP